MWREGERWRDKKESVEREKKQNEIQTGKKEKVWKERERGKKRKSGEIKRGKKRTSMEENKQMVDKGNRGIVLDIPLGFHML